MDSNESPPLGKQIWDQFASPRPGQADPNQLTDLDLAAFIAGGAEFEDSPRIERAIARSPESRRALADIADFAAMPAVPVPAPLVTRARGVLSGVGVHQATGRGRLFLPMAYRMVQVLAAAAVLLASLAGFQIGKSTFNHNRESDSVVAAENSIFFQQTGLLSGNPLE